MSESMPFLPERYGETMVKKTEKPEPMLLSTRVGGRTTKLKQLMEGNPLAYEKMLAVVRAGAYMHVVASAVGIHPETLARWMSKGAEAKGGLYRKFYEDMMEAAAQARVAIEVKVAHTDPKFWLTRGPGKWVNPEAAGWDDTDYSEQLVKIEGEVAHQHSLSRAPVDDESLATALLELERCGAITLTDIGRSMVNAEREQKKITNNTDEIIDVEVENSSQLPADGGTGG